jgi:hypothetical protein
MRRLYSFTPQSQHEKHSENALPFGRLQEHRRRKKKTPVRNAGKENHKVAKANAAKA